MKKVIFLGDSITAGENNDGVSFADYYAESSPDSLVLKIACSGTTFGEYSIYPVERHSLSYVVQDYANTIRGANVIFIEYGLNDAVACSVGNASYSQVLLSFIRCLDAISQLAPTAEIYFLGLGSRAATAPHFIAISNYLFGSEGYLEHYLSDFQVSSDAIASVYYSLSEAISRRIKVISMFSSEEEVVTTFSSDNLHPNDDGHRLIAKNIFDYFVHT